MPSCQAIWDSRRTWPHHAQTMSWRRRRSCARIRNENAVSSGDPRSSCRIVVPENCFHYGSYDSLATTNQGCIGSAPAHGKPVTAQSACADALLIWPVVLNPLWGFNRKLLGQKEFEKLSTGRVWAANRHRLHSTPAQAGQYNSPNHQQSRRMDVGRSDMRHYR